MGARKRKIIRRRKAELEARLELYKEAERKMLSGDVQSYTIGSRNLARYQLSLGEIRDEIEKLEDEIADLEGELMGCKARKASAVVIRDW